MLIYWRLNSVLDEIHGDFAKNLSGRYLSGQQLRPLSGKKRYADHHGTDMHLLAG
jgi:hypothetical protein